ncbi:MAG TPA: hypothetical protein VGC54_13800 [Planctomycetota bacterium]
MSASTGRGIRYLLDHQWPDGAWRIMLEHRNQHEGATALVAYALVKAGLPHEHSALTRALAFLETRPPQFTYDAAMRCLLLTALDPEAHRDRILRAMEVFDETPRIYYTYQGAPAGAGGDLSNTQFAVVALQALERVGHRISDESWLELLETFVDAQHATGGWGYGNGGEPTPTMSLAGFACLAACRNVLAGRGARDKVLAPADAALDKGRAYLSAHWMLDEPRDVGPLNRWFWYGCYGLERAMSLTGTDRLGEHDWYAEIAEAVLAGQGSAGNWGTPWADEDVSTAFCLLALSRATAVAATGQSAPSKGLFEYRWNTQEAEAELRITAVGAPRTMVFVSGANSAELAEYVWPEDSALRVLRFQWLIDGSVLQEVRRTPAEAAEAAASGQPIRFEHEFDMPGNGRHTLQARMWVHIPSWDASEPLEIESPPLPVEVSGMFEERHAVEIETQQRSIRFPNELQRTISASSEQGGATADRAFDRYQVTSWQFTVEDPEPWVGFELRKPVTVRSVRLLPAIATNLDMAALARPTEVRVTVNGQKFELTILKEELLDGVMLDFDKVLRLRKFELRVLERKQGSRKNLIGGFREIELLGR